MTSRTGARRINLALQGGGVHGAFTWGALERILQDEAFDIGWVSGTSAGAINAVALAHGLVYGGAKGAVTTLTNLWRAVEQAQLPDLVKLNPFMVGLIRAAPVPMASMFSPYEFNPLGFDPFRSLLESHIDFAAIRDKAPCELLIAATDVETGRPRIFRRNELTVEAVLASACLPMLHHAVMIDERPYWDGGFTANPELLTVAAESPVRDTLIVQLNPTRKSGVPKTPGDISDRANTITFNRPYLRDIEEIVRIQQEPSRWFTRDSRALTIKRHRFHLIEAGRHLSGLNSDTKVKADSGILRYLHNAGRAEAHKWLERDAPSVGKTGTVDLRAKFLD